MTEPATATEDSFALAAQQEVAERRERRRRAAQVGLLIHAVVFVCIQLLLVVIWAVTGRGMPWFLFPLFGWGAGLAAHAVATRSLRR